MANIEGVVQMAVVKTVTFGPGFASKENIEIAQANIDAWSTRHPEAAQELADMWEVMKTTIGHKRIAYMIMGRDVEARG